MGYSQSSTLLRIIALSAPDSRRARGLRPLPPLLYLLLAASLLLGSALPAQALELVLAEDALFRSQNAATGIEYLRDPTGKLTWDEAQQQPDAAWTVSPADVPSFGFDAAAYWLRLQVRNDSTVRQSLVLDIAYPILDDIQAHVRYSGDAVETFHLGDTLPFANRPIDHHNFALPLKLDAGTSASIYLRVQTGTSMQIPLTLWDREHFFEQQQRYLMGQGLYFGILLVMAVYNLFIFVSVRHSAYVYYAISVVGMAFFMASLHGFGFQYVWPAFPGVNNWITTVSLSLFVGGAAAFTNALLQMKKNSPRYYYILLATALVYAALILLTPWLSYAFRIKVGTGLGVASSLTALAAGSYLLHKGVRTARYYVMAYSFLVFGFVALSLNKFGLLPRNSLTEFSAQICSVIEIVLLSFALADRINEERREKYKAKQQALEHEQRAREEQERYLRLRYSAQLEELQAQQKIIAAQAESRAKSEFLATMSHEIRTPMNGVLGMAELLQDTELQPQQRQYLDVITSSGKALLHIINDILDYSKISAGKLALEQIEFDLTQLCRDCIAMFAATAERKHISLHCTLEEGTPPRIQGDPTRLRQILLNLLGNAFKFTPKGEIRLRVLALSPPDASGQTRLRFEVRDTGIGISAEAQARLFQEFAQADSSITREYGGTGLGLSISQRLVQLMGGEIGVQSEAGKGSAFWFTLPCQAVAASANSSSGPAAESDANGQRLRGRRVLVVEDNPVNLMVINGMLKKLGMICETADNGQTALELLRDHHPRFDLVLMDCEMPVLDGYAAARALRDHEREQQLNPLPVIALSAHVLPEHQDRARDCGMDDHLAKPLEFSALKIKLVSCLRNAPVASPLGLAR